MTPETKSEMTPERYRQVQRALEQALECAESERAAYLDAACGADAALRREVESLLAADAHAASFIESPAVARRAVPEGAESIAGLRLGAYRVVGELGRGGMGAVYLAVRADDLFEKRVAVKLVKRGMDTDEIVRRFEHERQILAALEHPNVARLIDAGATADGRPYFVMEYVEGVPIDEYCERRELGVRERLELFRKVSAAVEYAHRHFIVHRDLKPSNILIGADGEPKLLDFGIAKLVQEGAAEGTLTAAGLRPMTPEYASPEQARGLTVTAASDVYSLGVVLYELLTRQRPYELKSRTPDEMLGVICREEPEKPSLAVARGGAAEKLRRQLRGDLDNIVLTALRKEPERRYRSVEQFSEDIRRYLDGLPVMARQDTFRYRAGKFVRRHKAGAAMAALMMLTLLGGITAATQQAYVARRERAQAIEQRDRAAAQELANRRLLYAAHLSLAQQAREMNSLTRMRELLTGFLPLPGQEDLRGFEWYYLWRLCHGYLFAQHADAIGAVAFSPDGKILATGSWDQTVKLWEVATGRDLATLSGHTGRVTSLAFSPDGSRLATASGDGTVRLWETLTAESLVACQGHTAAVNAVAFSPDGKNLATGSDDRTAKLWEVATGREVKTFRGHADRIEAVAFAPHGRKLATGSADHTVKLWETATGRELATLRGHKAGVKAVAFSPDAKRLATGSWDERLKLWDATRGRELLTLNENINGFDDGLRAALVLKFNAVAFSPDGKILATGDDQNTVSLWDVATGRELAALKGHRAPVLSVAFSPDGKSLATGSSDHTVMLWDVTTGRDAVVTLRGHTERLNEVAFSPDGKMLATASHDDTVKLWEVATGRNLATLRGHAAEVYSVTFSRGGEKLVTGSYDGTAKLWEVVTGRDLVTFSGHSDRVESVALSPDGKTLATGSDDRTAKLWDLASGRVLTTLRGHADVVYSVAFSPDGRTLATGSYDRTAKLWEVATGQERLTLAGHTDRIWSVAFSPDGRWLVTGSKDGTVKYWDLAAGREVLTLKGHAAGVGSVAFSPDGQRLATASDDGTVKLWQAATEQELLTLKGRGDWHWINDVKFSPDGKNLAAGASDATIKLWRAATGREVLARGEQ